MQNLKDNTAEFIINDVSLRVFPTDITVMEKRYTDTAQFVRDHATYSVHSKFARTRYNVIIAFDLGVREDLDNLVKLLSEFDKYPFAFIKSRHLETMVRNITASYQNYYIYGIESYTLTQHVDMQNIIILDVSLIYFNYHPLTKDFSFVTASKSKVIKKIPKRGSESDKPADTMNGLESFIRFVKPTIDARKQLVDRYLKGQMTSAGFVYRGEATLYYPKFTETKPQSGIFEKITMTGAADDSDTPKVGAKDIWVVWEPVLTYGRGETLNHDDMGTMLAQSIAITKNNNFAVNHISDWTHPIVQYMGKGQATVNVIVKASKSDIEDSIEANVSSSLDAIRGALKRLEVNFTQYPRYSAYNVLRLESLITSLSPSFGYVLDQESLVSTSNEQGVYTYQFLLKESDIRNLMKWKLFTPGGTQNSDFEQKDMEETFDKIATELLKQPPISKPDKKPVPDEDTRGQKVKGLTNHEFALLAGDTIRTESSGNPAASNGMGYYGLYQFGPSALATHGLIDMQKYKAAEARAGGKMGPRAQEAFMQDSSNWTIEGGLERFINDVDLQNETYRKFTNANINAGFRSGALNENSTPEHIAGYAKAAHIAGARGASNLVNEGKNPSDALGTSAAKYYEDGYRALNGSIPDRISDMLFNNYGSEIESMREELADAEADYKDDPEKLKAKKNAIYEKYHDMLMVMADNGAYKLRPYMQKYINEVKNDPDSFMDSFDGEAIDDLGIGEALGNSLGDPRDLPPFFFLNHKPYITYENLKMAYQFYAKLSEDQIDETLNRIAHTGAKSKKQLEVSTKHIRSSETNDYKDVKLNGALNTGPEIKMPEEYVFEDGTFSNTDIENVDPFNEAHQAEYRLKQIATQFLVGINQAFPTIRVYLVTEDESDFRQTFRGEKHGFFELRGIQSMKLITNNDNNPVDVCHMVLANPGSIYTDDSAQFSINAPKKGDPGLFGTSEEYDYKKSQLRIRPGNRLHIRVGYSNNINHLTTIFNGPITEVGGTDIIEVVAEGFGRELIAYEHGDDPSEDHFFMSADTKSILANALYTKEISHFGTWKLDFPPLGPSAAGNTLQNFDSVKAIVNKSDPEIRSLATFSPSGLFKWSFPTARFSNIYVDEITSGDESFNLSFLNSVDFFGEKQVEYFYPIYKTTAFEMLKEMEFRHPGALSKPMIYGTRMTYFFGTKEQLYLWRNLKQSYQKGHGLKTFLIPEYEAASSLYGGLRGSRFRPAASVHLFTSQNNIISNQLKISSDFNTVVNVRHYDSSSNFAEEQFDYFEMKADDNLKPHAHRRGELEMPGVHGKYMAFRYGTTYLRLELERMYDGKIVVIGNPDIKAGDYAYLDDARRGLKGMIKVREAIHHFDLDNGYITEITPGLYVEASEYDTSKLFSKLTLALSQVSAAIKVSADDTVQSNSSYLALSAYLDLANAKAGQSVTDNLIGTAIQTTLSASLYAAGTATFIGKDASKGMIRTLIDSNKGTASRFAKFVKEAVVDYEEIRSMLKKSERLSALGKSALALAKGGINFVRISPVGLLAGVVVNLATATFEEISLTRQPLRIYPLLQNQSIFIGGIDGYEENSYLESMGDNLVETKDAAKDIINLILQSTSS